MWETESDDQKPLAEQLLDAALELLFCPGLTIPRVQGSESGQPVYAIWETGVGSSTPLATSHELQSNKVEVLRLLLTLISDTMYRPPNKVVTEASKYAHYVVTRNDKQLTMTLLCSLLNTTLKYSPGWKVPYNHVIIADRNRQLVIYSLQTLLVMLIHPVPQPSPHPNYFRQYLGKVHRLQDLQFIADALTKLLSQPIHASYSYLPGSQREIHWVTELASLCWELFQVNKKFRSYLISSCHGHDFVILFLYYVREKRYDASMQPFVRLCSYILLFLTSDVTFAKSLTKKFEGQQYLPANVHISSFNGSYSEYLILQLLTTIGTSEESRLGYYVPTFLETIYNVSPYVVSVSYTVASQLLQFLSSLADAEHLKEPYNQLLATNLVLSLNNMVVFNFHSNRKLIFALIKNSASLAFIKTYLDALNKGESPASAAASASRLSAKAKGKLPTEEQTAETHSLPDKVVTMLPVLGKLIEVVEEVRDELSVPEESYSHQSASPPHSVIEKIGQIQSLKTIDVAPRDATSAEVEPVRFYWNHNTLGWYESVIWGSIYKSESNVAASSPLSETGAIAAPASSVGVWNGTHVRLFRLQETRPTGPSLMHPVGAVDAVAESVLHRFEQFRVGSGGSQTGPH